MCACVRAGCVYVCVSEFGCMSRLPVFSADLKDGDRYNSVVAYLLMENCISADTKITKWIRIDILLNYFMD